METSSNSNHHHQASSVTIKSEIGIKEKRKRKKFIRKVNCQVCEDVANDHIHYGATTCYSCRAFFRRSITAHAHYKCAKTNNCVINPQTRQRFSTYFPIYRFWSLDFSLFINKALFRNKRFVLDEMTQWNASKFAIFYIYENPKLLFPFCATLRFPLMNALVYVDIDQGIC